MKNLGLDVLELFAFAQQDWRDSPAHRRNRHYADDGLMRVARFDAPPTPEQKKRWRDANKELQKLYSRRNYARKVGKPLPPIKLVKVEIFWEGQHFWLAEPGSSVRLGGGFETMHKAWKYADRAKYEVVDYHKTRGNRGPL